MTEKAVAYLKIKNLAIMKPVHIILYLFMFIIIVFFNIGFQSGN